MNKIPVLAIVLLVAFGMGAKKKETDPRLKQVRLIFVKGNSEAAGAARDFLRSGKSCLSLASNPDSADATLELNAQSEAESSAMGNVLGARHDSVSGTVTLRSGDLIWSDSKRFSAPPGMSGGKASARILLDRLSKDCECGKK